MKTRKELKEAYKQMKPQMGVFQIRNVTNNRVLVDASTDMLSKWNRHRMELTFGNHRNRSFQKDWNETEAASFVFEILSELKPSEEENPNYQKELQALREMVLEELKIPKDRLYS